MPRTVTTYTRRWEDSDSFQADPETPDSVDSEVAECVTDDWSTAVIEAVELLRANGCTKPSSSPGFFEDMWYSEVDGGSTVNYRTGAYHELSAHLDGFTVGEQRQIWQLVTGQLSVLEANLDRR
jgi:hypothetical protein